MRRASALAEIESETVQPHISHLVKTVKIVKTAKRMKILNGVKHNWVVMRRSCLLTNRGRDPLPVRRSGGLNFVAVSSPVAAYNRNLFDPLGAIQLVGSGLKITVLYDVVLNIYSLQMKRNIAPLLLKFYVHRRLLCF